MRNEYEMEVAMNDRVAHERLIVTDASVLTWNAIHVGIEVDYKDYVSLVKAYIQGKDLYIHFGIEAREERPGNGNTKTQREPLKPFLHLPVSLPRRVDPSSESPRPRPPRPDPPLSPSNPFPPVPPRLP